MTRQQVQFARGLTFFGRRCIITPKTKKDPCAIIARVVQFLQGKLGEDFKMEWKRGCSQWNFLIRKAAFMFDFISFF